MFKAFGFDGPFDFLPDKLDAVFINGIGPPEKIKRYGVLRHFLQKPTLLFASKAFPTDRLNFTNAALAVVIACIFAQPSHDFPIVCSPFLTPVCVGVHLARRQIQRTNLRFGMFSCRILAKTCSHTPFFPNS
ncbi:hypothetical protein [Treponema endosymbiont of Eucomonympha sp.]|uniref:hypothetical protein n=1 Tax=Treponema endosymbiont of Eucomonympha sp. TaxID=1580831 RepID=UPI000783AE16|nr:hypothetical protein [Treponema endosymbiont of Eucomonympha sp.]